MALDTEIQVWEQEGDLSYAIDEPTHIYVRGEPDVLKRFLYAFNRVMRRDITRESFEQLYAKAFDGLAQAEAERLPFRGPNTALDISCERFYLQSRCGWKDEGQLRHTALLDYHNRYKDGNFKDMQEKFDRAIRIYKDTDF